MKRILLNFFYELNVHGLINKNIIDRFINFLKNGGQKESFWHIRAGIKCIKYTGKYFDKICADYDLERMFYDIS